MSLVTLKQKIKQLIDKVYIEYPLPQDECVYYRFPPCNEDRYIRLNTSQFEYGTLNADGYTYFGMMNGVAEGSQYKFIIPAHTKDFIIRSVGQLPTFLSGSADCTEVYVGKSTKTFINRQHLYINSQLTINGLKKLVINIPINQQLYTIFKSLSCQTIKLNTVKGNGASYDMFSACIYLRDLQFEEIVIPNPTNMFNGCRSLESINCSKIVPSGSLTNMFNGCSSLRTLDLSSWAGIEFTNVNGLFRYCTGLITLNLSGWDLNHITSVYDWFDGNPNLEDLILDNTVLFSASFSVAGCPKLTQESIAGILNALPTVTTAKTLTLHPTMLPNLTDEQVQIAKEKNWTIK